MKAYLINVHLLVPRSRSSAKVKVKYKGHISQKMTVSGAFVFHKHILFNLESTYKPCSGEKGDKRFGKVSNRSSLHSSYRADGTKLFIVIPPAKQMFSGVYLNQPVCRLCFHLCIRLCTKY